MQKPKGGDMKVNKRCLLTTGNFWSGFYHTTLCVSIIMVFAVTRCPSVCCPSVTLVDCIQTAEDIVKLLPRPSSPIILVFCAPAPVPNSSGVQNTQGGKILRFSTEITVYLGNGTR